MRVNNQSKKPLVSIYIPTKNRFRLLERAINSVLSQTYENIEIIVVDDGSTDETPQLLTMLSESYSNFHWCRFPESKGAPAARNHAIYLAKGQLVTGLDDDDYFLPKRIEHLVDSFDEKYSFICSGFYWNHGKAKIKSFGTRTRLTLKKQLYFNHASNQVLMLTERAKEVGGFDLEFSSCQDWDMWNRLIKRFGPALRISKVDYVVDSSHEGSRITNSPMRIKGFKLLAKRYHDDMDCFHRRSMKFNFIAASKAKLTALTYFQVVTVKTFFRVTKYWFACLFPNYAKKRLAKMK